MSFNRVHFSSLSCEWPTPAALYRQIDAEFHFDLDAASTPENAKCPRFFTQADDALTNEWKGTVFVNPPYSRKLGQWIQKARTEAQKGATVVCLLPARTDTRWFHEDVLTFARDIRFIKGRLKFGGAKNSAPFPSMVVVF